MTMHGISRRGFLRQASLLAAASLALPSRGVGAAPVLRRGTLGPAPALRIPATLFPGRFALGTGDDARYHALVSEGGEAAGRSLLVTPVQQAEVARVLRAWGAEDAGGVPMAAWTLRRVPLVLAPERRVAGSAIRLLVEWDGWEEPLPLERLLEDPGGRGIDLRFGGNEGHAHLWESGCIVCLFSCPGGVLSNAAYSIRDHVRERTRFAPAAELPPDGTPVSVVITLEE